MSEETASVLLEWSHFLQSVADFTGVDIDTLTKETNIYNDLGLDSLGLFSLGMHLIKTYKIKIPLAAVATITTIDDIYTLMQKQRDAGAV
jgi:acyl carrier protein